MGGPGVEDLMVEVSAVVMAEAPGVSVAEKEDGC